MTKKMLIDASHPEETRVVIVDGNRVEELDFESRNKRQIRGNVYLARVTRVEPSLFKPPLLNMAVIGTVFWLLVKFILIITKFRMKTNSPYLKPKKLRTELRKRKRRMKKQRTMLMKTSTRMLMMPMMKMMKK